MTRQRQARKVQWMAARLASAYRHKIQTGDGARIVQIREAIGALRARPRAILDPEIRSCLDALWDVAHGDEKTIWRVLRAEFECRA